MTRDFPVGPMKYGPVEVILLFRCECGQLCAMADQPSGDAAILHESPHCDRFDALSTRNECLSYFSQLDQVPLLETLLAQLRRNSNCC